MVLVLPHEKYSLDKLVSQMKPQHLSNMLATRGTKQVSLALPRFKLSTQMSLVPTLMKVRKSSHWTEHRTSSPLCPYPPSSPSVLHNHTQLSDTPHSVGLLWVSDQPDAETSSWQHTSNVHDPVGIRTHNPSKRDSRLRPRGHLTHFQTVGRYIQQSSNIDC